MTGKVRLKKFGDTFYKVLRFRDGAGRFRDRGLGAATEQEFEQWKQNYV